MQFDVFGMAQENPYDIIELETKDSLKIVVKGKNAEIYLLNQ